LVAALRTGQRRLYFLSGMSIGAAVLTKSPALVMGPLMLGAILAARLHSEGLTRAGWRGILQDLLWVGIPALIVVFALWPALWVKPLDTLGGVWGLMTAYGGGEHELGNYWLGRPAPEPGSLFYLLVLALRTTPVTLIGLLLALAGSVLRSNPARGERWPIWAFWASVLWFGLILSFGAKKFDRYLLPIFPVLDILAAWGWLNALGWLAGRLQTRRNVYASTAALAAVWAGAILLVGAQAWSALSNRPSYLTAYNPLVGGIRAAADNVLVGWGEGLAEAAAYLNDQPDAERSHAAAWYGKNVFGAFYRGESLDLYYDASSAADLYAHDVDWVVTYINQEQRALLDPSIRARLGAPVYRVTRDGVTLAAVFAWPKPFAHTTNRAIAEGVNLLGWQVEGHDRAAGALPVIFYWNAPALARVSQQRFLVWLKDSSGEVWAMAEDMIGAERLSDPGQRAAGWLDQPVIAQSVALRPPVGLHPGVYRIELALFAGAPIELTRLQISPTRLAEVVSLGPGVYTPAAEVRYDEVARLVGDEIVVARELWTVDLLWEWLEPSDETYHYFVHVVDAAEQMIAQQDGPLAERGGTGELTRQRIHLQLPASAADTVARVYVGIYRPQDGVRAPLTVGGRSLPDGRYLLVTRP